MYEKIIDTYNSSKYDFRQTANPEDPLSHLFDEWIDYYKLKWSIARVLNPSSILEVGVRFGYSAVAFLEGYPSAKYVGIDLDTDLYGGVKGAINWAKKITQQFNCQFIVADTQAMESFPGEMYDLIHIDGQQDGDSSFHDLELAVKQSKYVLLDGYFWSRQNFLAVNEFLIDNASLFDWYSVIPGYAGELIVKVSDRYLCVDNNRLNERIGKPQSSLEIRKTYTTEYFLQDCGGFKSYKANNGKILQDPRLAAVAGIASVKNHGRLLDLGCGRGELTYHFADRGFSVTSIDYSLNAIQLAQNCFAGNDHLRDQVEFICDDVCNVKLLGGYDLAVASDIIEHLSCAEVDILYEKISECLNDDGILVIHTFPNLWYYKYHYSRQRKIAASVGAYLSPEPRSRYELLMHINEQSPRILRKQLKKYFKNVYLWFGDPINPGGSLVKHFSIAEMRAASSLFAVASHQPIDRQLIANNLQMKPLPPISSGQLRLIVTKYPSIVSMDSEFIVQLEIENRSKFIINSYGSHPVNISYHWMNQDANEYIVFDGERTRTIPNLPGEKSMVSLSGHRRKYRANVKALSEKGSYVLRVTLVQEAVRWFDTEPSNLYQDIGIQIVEKL